MKKKVLQFIHGMTMGGAETLVKEYCLKLDKEKYDVSVLCFYKYHLPYEKILEDAGIQITYIEDIKNYPEEGNFKYLRRILLMLKRVFYVKKYLKKEQPDIIHTHLNNNTYIWAARPKRGTKIFHTIHSELTALWEDDLESKIDFYAAKQLIKKYRMRFITLHEQMRIDTNELFNVKDSVILNNGIDFDRFEKALSKEEIRQKEGIPADAFVVGHVGRFNENKNQDFLVDVFYEIYKNNPKAYLLMIGNGDTLPDIREKLETLGLTKNSKILSYRTDIPDLLSSMDRFVLPSKYEGLPIVLIEAQKMKLPCIISDSISDSVKTSNLIKKMDLNLPVIDWAKEIELFHVENILYDGLKEWDIRQVVRNLEKIYEE